MDIRERWIMTHVNKMNRILYKYYSPNALSEKYIATLNDKQFWFGGNKIQNDPYDLIGVNEFFNTYFGQNIIKYVKDKNGDTHLLRNQILQFASCSFSRVATERLMWAHYANSYEGFCVAYSFSENAPLKTIIYQDKYPIRGLVFTNNVDLNIKSILEEWIRSPKIDTIKQLIIYLSSIKSQEWVYEQEVRLVDIIPSASNGVNFPWSNYDCYALDIIFGSRFQHNLYGARMYNILSKWNISQSHLFEISTNALEHFEINLIPLSKQIINQYYQLPI